VFFCNAFCKQKSFNSKSAGILSKKMFIFLHTLHHATLATSQFFIQNVN